MKLVFIHGPPGVGKLTVARELQLLTGFRLFHNHLTVDLAAAVFDFRSRAFAEVREQIWLLVMQRAAEDRLAGLIFTFVFEPTVLPGFFDRLTSKLADRGASVLPFELRCDVEEHLRRVVQPERLRFLKETSTESLRGGLEAGAYEPPAGFPNILVIDTTKVTARQTASLIAARLV